MSAFIKEEIRFPSADGKHQIAGFYYTPVSGEISAVIQLSHGMCEYICRYEPMFEVLTAAGFAVCGNDHLGHGDSAAPEDYGFAAEENGQEFLLKDLKSMNTLAREKYPGLPLFLLGHSMGSFYARWYGEKFPETINGLIISGTGGPNGMIGMGKGLASMLAKIRGPRYVSDLMVKISTGSYIKGIEQDGSGNAWLSRDPSVWQAYDADPRCGFPFTVSAYRDMLTVYQHVNKPAWAAGLNKKLPVLIYSGDRDPVGNFGKGVRAVYAMLQDAGMKDVTMKLYPGARHEMHNETNREEVFDDLLAWLKARI